MAFFAAFIGFVCVLFQDVRWCFYETNNYRTVFIDDYSDLSNIIGVHIWLFIDKIVPFSLFAT